MDEPVLTIQDSQQHISSENTVVPDNARVNTLHLYAHEAPPVQSVTTFTPNRIPDSEDLQSKAGYVNRQVDRFKAEMPEEAVKKLETEVPVNTAISHGEYAEVEDLNGEVATRLFDTEAETSINIERTLGRERAMELFSEIKNLTDQNMKANESVTELEAASGAIGRLTFKDSRFGELKDPRFYSSVQGWTHAIIGINSLAAQAVDMKMKAAHENFLANEKNNGEAFVKSVSNQ